MFVFSCASMLQCPILLGRGTAYSFTVSLPPPTSRDAAAASAYMAFGGGFGRCTLRPYYLTQISVWSGFKFQTVFLSPLTLHRKTLFASSSSQSSQRYYFPFVTPLRSPVACNCDLFCASVNSKVYYLQPSTLNILRFSASSALFA